MDNPDHPRRTHSAGPLPRVEFPGTPQGRPGRLAPRLPPRSARGNPLLGRVPALCLLAAWVLWQGAAAASPPGTPLDRLMRLLAQRRHGEVTFVERDTLAVLTRPLVSSGLMIYDAPDHLEKRTLEPRPSSLILDHGELTVKRGDRTYQLDLNDYPQVAPYVEAIADTLSGNRAALERLFEVRFAGSLAQWTLTLRPLDPRRSRIQLILIQGARDDIRTVRIFQTNGDHSRMTLGPPIPR